METKNYLEEAKAVQDAIAQSRDGNYELYGILNAIIAIEIADI